MEVENRIQRYETYKDSGVEWLGEIPEHWKIKPGFTVLSESKEKNTGFIEKTVLSLSYGNVVIKPEEKLTGLVPESFETYQLVKSGDIIIRPTDLQNDKTSLRTGLAKDNGIITSAYINLRVNGKNSNSFYHYYLHTIDINKVIYGLGSGLRQNISFNDFKRFPFPFPPLKEQTAIAQFLDDKTTKIDQAIAIKEQQINLLKERKQILIHKAVTRGLDDTVKLKDSGVEWIGAIPEHWEVKKLKYILKNKLKYGANESGIEYDIDLPRYVRITDFGTDGKLNEENKLSLSWKNGGDYLLKDGDILFARSGATVGKTYQFKKSMSVENDYCFAGYLIKAEANEEIILSDFLYLFTNSELFNKWKDSIFIKATIENIGADKYAQLPVILPSIIKQKEILLKYEADNKKIETAISLKQQEIEKLKEYKSSLINSVVTGKVRVC
ncbi:restriction endonuclease subunit S [Mariniflexile jejuense]|uniref:Restriction endonuclease subunit S n=1 Tax=Mariniflexile jejuense TaxID=1173582 RepID=A0ABW3JIZ4_9FLAO